MNLRVETIFSEVMRGDNSFKERDGLLTLLFGGRHYTKKDMRDTWDMGIKLGIEIGLNNASLEGQAIELTKNIEDPRHREFVEKVHELAEEYKCAIQYHSKHGMVIIDRDHQKEYEQKIGKI